MALEQELRQRLIYELTEIEGVSELWLEALDKQDAAVLMEATPPSPEAVAMLQWRILGFCREAIFQLAREIDELKGEAAED